MKYDLHIRSNISDGKLNRDEIFKLAKENNLEYISFTEHNTFEEFKTNNFINIANKYGLIMTSGSDYHGKEKEELGVENDYSNVLIRKHF